MNSLIRPVPFALAGILAFALASSQPGHAAPQGGNVVAGLADIVQSGATTTIDQASNKAIINWQGFSIDVNELVKFVQPGAGSVALNRVTGADPSSILGELTANGRVFLLNPNGILFGAGSKIDVAGLAATTFGIKDDDFLAGKYEFLQDPNGDPSFVINRGEIKVAKNGFCFLVAPSVRNEGLLIAEIGKVVLGAGDKLTLDFNGDGLIKYEVSGKVLQQVTGPDGTPLTDAVSNTGTLRNDGGQIVLTGDAAESVVASVVNNEGIVAAKSLVTAGGEVKLVGGNEGIVQNKGTIDVSAAEAGAASGSVSLTGDKVGNFDTILAQGAEGSTGGEVSLRSTSQTLVAPAAVIDVSGVGDSGAGTIDLCSDASATAAGALLARGGDLGGDGGFIEVSSHGGFAVTGSVDTMAPLGESGMMLLDPKNVYLGSSGSAGQGEVNDFDDTPGDNKSVNVSSLTGWGNVTIEANNDIVVDAAFTMSSNLTLRAGRTVDINEEITMTSGNLTIEANHPDAIEDHRESGPGGIEAEAVTFDAGAGTVHLQVHAKTDGKWEPGTISLDTIEAGTITVDAAGPLELNLLKATDTLTLNVAGETSESVVDPPQEKAGDDWTVDEMSAEVDLIATNTMNINGSGVDGEVGSYDNPLEFEAGVLNVGVTGIPTADFEGAIYLHDIDHTDSALNLHLASVDNPVVVNSVDAGNGLVDLRANGAEFAFNSRIVARILRLTTNKFVGPDRDWDFWHPDFGFPLVNPHYGEFYDHCHPLGTPLSPIQTNVTSAALTSAHGGIYVDEQDAITLDATALERGFMPVSGAEGDIIAWDDTDPKKPEKLENLTSSIEVRAAAGIGVNEIRAGNMVVLNSLADGIVDMNQAEPNILCTDLYLTATGGIIGQPTDPLETAVVNIPQADATGGGVHLFELDGALVPLINALGPDNDVLLATGGGTLELGLINAPGGNVTVQAHTEMITDMNGALNNIDAAAATLEARTGIGVGSSDPIEVSVTELTTKVSERGAPTHVANSLGLSSLDVETKDGPVIIDFAGGGLEFEDPGIDNELTVTSSGGLNFVFENTGTHVTLKSVDAGSEPATIIAETAILDHVNDDGSGHTVDVIGGTVTLTAGTKIGEDGRRVDTQADELHLSADNGGIYIHEADGALLVAKSKRDAAEPTVDPCDIKVESAAGDLTVETALSADDVYLTASGGRLLDDGDAIIDVSGTYAELAGRDGIGAATPLPDGDPLDVDADELIAESTAGGIYLYSHGPVTLTTVATNGGGDISVTSTGDMTLGEIEAAGHTATLWASTPNSFSRIIDGNGAALNLTADWASLAAAQVGAYGAPNEIDTQVETLTCLTSGAGLYIHEVDDLIVDRVEAQGMGSDAWIESGGTLFMGATDPGTGDVVAEGLVKASGDSVALKAAASIFDGNDSGGEERVNVEAHLLDIEASTTPPDGIAPDGNALECMVDTYGTVTGGSGPGGAAPMYNAKDLAITKDTLETSSQLAFYAASITVLDMNGTQANLTSGQPLVFMTKSGNVVFLNEEDTIAASGGATITIDAGKQPSFEQTDGYLPRAVAVIGNLTTDGGSISVKADSTITIGLLDTGGTGDVEVTSNHGVILDGNGPDTNIIGSTVTLSGNTPSKRKAELQTMFGIADASAARAEAAADATTALSLETARAIAQEQKEAAQDEVNKRQEDYDEKQATADADTASWQAAETAAQVADGVAAGLGVATSIAVIPKAVAQAIPLTGDGGADGGYSAIHLAQYIAETTAYGLNVAADELGQISGGTSDVAAEAQAELYAAEAVLSQATSTTKALEEAQSVAQEAADAAAIARDHAYQVRDQAIAAEDQANVLGTVTGSLGVSADRLNLMAGDSSVYLDAPGDLGLGEITATGEGAEVVVAAVGDLSVKGPVTATTLVSLNAGDEILDGSGEIVAPDFLAVAAHGFGAADPSVAPPPSGVLQMRVDRFAADAGTGGVSVTNDRPLIIGTLAGTAGVTAGGAVSISSSGSMTLEAPITAPGQTVTLDLSVGGATGELIDMHHGAVDVTGTVLTITAPGGIEVDTASDELTASAVGASPILIREQDQVILESVTTDSGVITVSAGGSIEARTVGTGGDVRLIAATGTIDDDNDNATLITGDGLVLSAPGGIGATGAFGTRALDTQVATLTQGTVGIAGELNLAEVDDLFVKQVTLVDGDVTITSDTGTLTMGVVNAYGAGNTATFLAPLGAIIDYADTSASNVNAANLAWAAGLGIGTQGNALDVTVDAMEADGGTGGVFVTDLAGGLTIGGVTPGLGTGALNGVLATGSHVAVTANSPLTIDEPVANTGGGDLTLTAGASAAQDDLTLNASVTASGGDGKITLIAGDSVLQNAGGDVSAAGAGDVSVTAQAGSITMANGVGTTVETADVFYLAAANIAVSEITTAIGLAGGNVTLTATAGAITDANGAAVNITADELFATAGTGLGTAGDPLDTELDKATAAITAAGPVVINEADALTLTEVTTINGPITVTTGADLIAIRVVSHNDTDANDIALTATGGGRIVVDTISAGLMNGDVTLTANTGAGTVATSPGPSGRVTADLLTATAVNGIDLVSTARSADLSVTGAGSVILDELDAVTLTDVDTVNGPITVTAGGTIDASDVQSLTDADPNDVLLVSTAGGIAVDHVAAGAGVAADVELQAAQTITETTPADASADVTGQLVTFGAGMGIGVGLGGPVDTAAVALVAHADDGDLSLNESDGVILGSIVAKQGNVTITTEALGAGDTLVTHVVSEDPTGDVSLTSLLAGTITVATLTGLDDIFITATHGAIVDDNVNATLIQGQTLALTAPNGIGAVGALDTRALDTQVTTVTSATAATAGEINLAETDGMTVTGVATANGNVTITSTTGDLKVGTVVADTANDTVTVIAAAGALTDADGDDANNLTGANLALTAATGIGTAADPIETTVANLEATGGTGGVFVTDLAGGLVIGGVTPGLGNPGLTGVLATGNDVAITALSPLTVDEAISNTGGGNIVLTAGQSAALDDLTLNAPVAATGGNGSVTLSAGDSILQNANLSAVGTGGVAATATAGAVTMAAGTSTTVETGNVGYAAGTDVAVELITTTTGSTGGNVSLTATAGGILDVNDDAAVDVIANALSVTSAIGLMPLETTIDGLSVVTTAAGPIIINETGAVTLTNIVSADGPITVTAGGTINAVNVVSTTDAEANDIVLTATAGDVLVKSIAAGAGVNADVTLTATGSVDPSDPSDPTDPSDRIVADVLTVTAVNGIGGGANGALRTTVNSADLSVTGIGSLLVNELDAITLTDLDTAVGLLTVTAGGTITATDVRSLTDDDDNDVTLTATAGGVIVNLVSAGGGAAADATITAAGAIDQSDPSDPSDDLIGDHVVLTAGTGIGTGVGGPLDTAANTLVATTTAGDLNVDETDDVTLQNVEATAGRATVTAGGTMTVETVIAANDTTLIASVINDDNVNTTRITSGTLTLTAPNGLGVNGANDTRALDTAVTTLTSATAATGGQINVAELDGMNVVLVQAANGGVTLTSDTGNLNVTSVAANTAGNTVTMIATAGAITDAVDDAANNVTATNLALTAATGIGTAANPLEVTVTNMEASGGTGGVFVTDLADGLVVGGVTPNLGNAALTGLQATGSDVVVTALSPLTINETVFDTGGGNITLTAGASAAQDDLTLNADVTATGGNGTVTLLAADSVLQNANLSAVGTGNVAATATAGSIAMAAGTSTTVENGNVTYLAANNVAVNEITTATGGAGGTVTVTATAGAISDVNGAAVNVAASSLLAGSATGIGTVADPLDTTVATITATTTATGPIVLNETDDVALTDVTTADGLITVTAGGAINAVNVVSTTDDDDNDLTLTATGDLLVKSVAAGAGAAGDVSLTAAGRLDPSNQSDPTDPSDRIIGDVVTLSAVSGMGGGGDGALRTTANTQNLTVTQAGPVVVDELDAVTVTGITAADGPITVTAGGTMTVTGGLTSTTDADANDIALTSTAGNLALDAAANAGTANGDVALSAGGAISATGGTPSAMVTGDNLAATAGGLINLTTTANTLNATTTAAGAITIAETDDVALTNVTAANGPITVTAGGSIAAVNVASTTDDDANDIALTATGGGSIAIDQVNAGTANGDVTLSANTGTGTITTNAGGRVTGDVLTGTAASGLNVTTTTNTQNLTVTQAGAVVVNELDAVTVTGITTVNGPITLTAGGTLTVAGGITSQTDADANDIALTATAGGIALDAPVGAGTANGDVALTSAGSLAATGGGPSAMVTGDNLAATASGPINLITTANTLSADSSAPGAITVAETDAVTLTNVASANGPIAVTANGTITANSVVSNTDADANDIALTATGGGSLVVGVVNAGAAAGDVTLSANTGSATIAMAPNGRVTGHGLTATAVNGISLTTTVNSADLSVTGAGGLEVTEQNALALTDLDTALGPISVTAGGAIHATDVQSLSDADANSIALNAGGDVFANLVAAGAGVAADVTISAAGAILQPAPADPTPDVVGDRVVLAAGTGIGTGAGGPVDTTANTLAATSTTGDLNLNETNGVTLENVTASDGSVAVTTEATGAGNTLVTNVSAQGAGSDVSITSQQAGTMTVVSVAATDNVALTATNGALDDDNVNTTLITGQTLAVTAPNGIGANGANDTRALDTQVATVTTATVATAGQLNLAEVDGVTVQQATTANGDVTLITATGNLNVGVVAANTPGNTATLIATAGAITDADGGDANNVTATNLAMTADQGIGTAADPIEVMVDSMVATGGTGGIYVTDLAGGIAPGGVTAGLGTPTPVGLSASGGDIVVTALSPIVVNEAISNTGGGDVILTAGLSDLLDDITLNAWIAVTGGDGSILLWAADSIHQNAKLSAVGGGNITATANGGSLNMAGGTSTTVVDGDLTYTAGDSLSLNGTTSATGNGSINLKAANTVAQTSSISTGGSGNVQVTGGNIAMAPGGTTTVGSGNVNYQSSGNLAVNQITTNLGGTGGNVTLNAPNGNLTDVNGTGVNVISNNLDANWGTGSASELNSTEFLQTLIGATQSPPDLILFENRIMGGNDIDPLTEGQSALGWLATGSALGSVGLLPDDLRDMVLNAGILAPAVYYRVEAGTE